MKRHLAVTLVVLTILGAGPAAGREPRPRITLFAGSTAGRILALDGASGEEVWSLSVGAKVLGSPVLDGERLVAVTSDALASGAKGRERGGRVLALDPESGKELWSVGVGASIDHAPAASSGLLLVASEDGALRALRAGSGEEVWRVDLGGQPSGPPLTQGDLVFVATKKGSLVATATRSGDVRWRTEFAGLSPTAPVAGHGVGVVGLPNPAGRASGPEGRLRALDQGTGKEQWRLDGSGPIAAAPSTEGGFVFALSLDCHLHAVLEHTGRPVWKKRLGDARTTFDSGLVCSPLVSAGTVFVVAHGLRALDAGTGQERWCVPYEGRTNGLSLGGDALVAASHGLGPAPKPCGPGSLLCLEPRSGKTRWRMEERRDGFVGPPCLWLAR